MKMLDESGLRGGRIAVDAARATKTIVWQVYTQLGEHATTPGLRQGYVKVRIGSESLHRIAQIERKRWQIFVSFAQFDAVSSDFDVALGLRLKLQASSCKLHGTCGLQPAART
jgi:hypothetical protein